MARAFGAALAASLASAVALAAWAQEGGGRAARWDVERGRAVAVGAFAAAPAGRAEVGAASGACFRCHGLDGAGERSAVFPRIAGQSYEYLYETLKDYATGVRQNVVMKPIAEALSDQQKRDVSAYYAAQDAPLGPKPEADAKLLQQGAVLAAVGSVERRIQGCANCHGPQGLGLGPTYPALAGQYASYIEAQLRAWKNGSRRGDPFAVMEMIAKQMTEEDVRSVAAYYASLRPAKADETAAVDPLPAPIPFGPGSQP